MLPFGPSKTPKSWKQNCKTYQKRTFDIRQQRSNALSQNIYKTNIKSMNSDVHRNHQKHIIKLKKIEHWQPSTNSHIKFHETFIKPISNAESDSVLALPRPRNHKKTNIKTKTNTHNNIHKIRTLATLHKLSHELSCKIYKTNIKYKICLR